MRKRDFENVRAEGIRLARMRGKVWFHPDGSFGHLRDESRKGGCIFFRDDPPQLEVYGEGPGRDHGQIYPSREQLTALRDFLDAYLGDG